jgi:hypothetical protein
VALVMAAMMLAMAMPAFADKGGIPHAGSCGLGKDLVHDAQEDPTSPLARPKRPMNLPAIPGIRALVPLRHRAPQEGPGPLATSALLLALNHRSAWKENSRKLAKEVMRNGPFGGCPRHLPSVIMCF